MTRAFTEIMFTEAVRATQLRMGTRDHCADLEGRNPRNELLEPRAIAFIESVDTAFLATSNNEGWPNVQHRGGPKGFIRVLSSSLIGFDDYDGNQQFISVGNISANPKVALILMDFERRARLKIWGHAKVNNGPVDAGAPSVTRQIDATRHIVVGVAAWDFNCSKHITKRVAIWG
jgi:predicted pyridoxine 5'-phosphate oxidase superfamily flavin-nucleotide-binding protein